MTHEQIDEQMVDFLYGELPADARAAFEAHVAGCERCRREVESFGRVRSVARTVLDEAPPPHAHDAILRAAREAAAAPAKAAAAATVPVSPPKPKKAEPARASLWDWLRGRWAFPTLATVGALTVFILGSRLFLNPSTVRQIGRPVPASESEASDRAMTKLAPSMPAPAPSAVVEAPPATEPTAATARSASPHRHAHPESKMARSSGAAAAPPSESRVYKKAMSDDPLAGFIGSPAPAPRKRTVQDDALDGLSDGASGGRSRDKAPAPGGGPAYAQPPPPAAEKPLANVSSTAGKAKKKAARSAEDMEEDRVRMKEEASDEPLEGSGRVYAPPARPAPAPSYAEAPPPKAAAEPENSPADDSQELAKSLPRRLDRQQSRASRGGSSAPAPPPPAASPPPVTASRARSEEADAEDQVAVRETLLERAERLFTQGRWAEAAIAYRDLLKQHPNSPNAERWRRRLAAARAAVATGRPPPPSAR